MADQTAARGVAGLFEAPIVGAPLGGGPSTPALAAAVSEAGGLGFLAAGYKTAAAVQAELDELKALTSKRVAINLFYPIREPVDERAIEAYAERMRREGERYGVAPGDPVWTDDDWVAKLELAADNHVDVVSFTFGCPPDEIVEWLQSAGCRVWCTVTSVAEAEQATSRDVDALVVQGAEAGGHRGSFDDHDDQPQPLIELLDRSDMDTVTADRGWRNRDGERRRSRAWFRRDRRATRIRTPPRNRSRNVGSSSGGAAGRR